VLQLLCVVPGDRGEAHSLVRTMKLYLCHHEHSVWVVCIPHDLSLLGLPNDLPIEVQPYPENMGPQMVVLSATLKKFNEASYQEKIISLEEEVRASNYASVPKIKLSEFDYRGRLALAHFACRGPGYARKLQRIKAFRQERHWVHPQAYCKAASCI
jgi:hypothetical protein